MVEVDGASGLEMRAEISSEAAMALAGRQGGVGAAEQEAVAGAGRGLELIHGHNSWGRTGRARRIDGSVVVTRGLVALGK